MWAALKYVFGFLQFFTQFLNINIKISQYLNRQIAKLIVVNGGAGGFREYSWFLAIFYSISQYQYQNISISQYLNRQTAKLIVVDGGACGFKEYPWFLAFHLEIGFSAGK